ncbi:DJ-1/PfpI family protein [Streptomyces sp. ST2-7A]|uniref:DJ-1/PfpI family protein n=1 Tax=Streptomyces sp. ST2-7A TaxID=2907214 RepID=UPI001F2E6F1F|nr:DJ-1/PfpI family protein [Streptomyces sp. ST2-7A]MCE7080864.1 DJ-1/PfpI family protein [Streptomyces sp. ST2-7A]
MTTPPTPPSPADPASGGRPRVVHLAVYPGLADWEYGHAIAELARRGYRVRAVGPDTAPVTTLGGVRLLPDLPLADLRPEDSALLLLSGADAWDDPEALAGFARAARRFLDAGVPVAAICGAVAGLAREGLLDGRAHTGAAAEVLAAVGYAGGDRYRDADAVTDGDLVTAGPTDPEAFARETLARLGAAEGEELDAWFRLYAHSDPTAYPVLAAAVARRAEAGGAADGNVR